MTGIPLLDFSQEQRKILDSLRVGTWVLFNSVPFKGYLFLLAARLCPICLSLDQVSLIAWSFLVGGKPPIVKLICPCPSSPYVGFLCFWDHCLSHVSGKCLSILVWVLLWGKSIGLNPNQVHPNSWSLSFWELSPSAASSDTCEISTQRSQRRRTWITKKSSLFVNNRRISLANACCGRVWGRLYF